jgi:glycosyltransferase involved in cell wall biosynthesis
LKLKGLAFPAAAALYATIPTLVRILIDYRPALRQRTGVGQYAHETAAALARLDRDQVTVFSSSWKDRLGTDVPPGTSALDVRIPVRVLNFAWHRAGWPPVEALGACADVVHSMHPLLMPSRSAARVVTIHDLYFLDHPERTRAEIRRDYAALARDHARAADGIVVVSEYTRGEVERRLGVPGGRITVCYPGAPDWRPRQRPPTGGPILFVGTLDPRKNVTGLLRGYSRLLARFPSAPPLLLAGGAGQDSAGVLQQIAQPPLAGKVKHLGYVADAERERLYAGASMLVLPSFDEGFGMPLLEAMTAGVPAIAARRGALPEVAGDAAILVEPEDDGALADAMQALLSDTALAREKGRAGIERAHAFNWDASAARLRAAYEAAIARRRERMGR